jgi:hypothetical protein
MKAVITCKARNGYYYGCRFYLTEEGYATDIKARAAEYRDITDADIAAAKACKEKAWKESYLNQWHGAYILADGSIADPYDDLRLYK